MSHRVWVLHHPLRATLVVLAALLQACGGGAGPGDMQMPAADVGVAEVIVRAVTEWDEFSGRIEAVNSVEIRPRVAGYLAEVHFQEGTVVAKGDLLFTIDQREYTAALQAAEAGVARAETRVALAKQEVVRGDKLLAAKALSAEEMDRRNGELLQANADLASTRAERQSAALNLEFTQLRAPIDGRVGEALVRSGNLVSPGDTLLTTVVSIDPIHVVFEGDERIYLKYQAQARAGERPSSRQAPNPVRVGLAGDTDYPFAGEMNFVDNQINPATGTIQGRAELPNGDGFLIPGLFARVRLLGSGEYEAVLINDIAVLTDQDRKYVYVVDADNRAQRRDIELGRSIDGLRVVKQGLAAGDVVIVNGVRKIFVPNSPVKPTVVPMESAARLPAGAATDAAVAP